MCIFKEELIKFEWRSIISKGEGKMEGAKVAKAIMLFATLIGIYTWMGQGASLIDILVLTFAATLILRIDSSAKEDIVITQEDVEPHFKESFFYKSTFPLS